METAIRKEVKPGDYYYTSWGYDQTNIDYIVVVGVSPTGKTATCRRADAINVGESGQSDVLSPGVACGDSFRLKVMPDGTLRGKYPYCIGHTSRRFGYFQPTQVGAIHYETMAEFGH